MPTVTSMFCTRRPHSLTLVSSCHFCFELRKRETDRERSTHMLVPRLLSADLKKELTLRNEKIQLVWFLANLPAMTKVVRSREICGGGKTAGGLQHLKQGPNQGLWSWDPWEQILSFCRCKYSASVAWQLTTKWWVSGTLLLLHC